MIYHSLKKKHTGYLLIIAVWIHYIACYSGRLNFSAALTEMVTSGAITKVWGGTVSSCFFFFYGAGYFINGLLSDRVSPFKLIPAGLFLAALSNLSMSFLSSPIPMCIAWAINGYAQSMACAPVLGTLSQISPREMSEKAVLQTAPSIPAGTLLIYLVSMVLLSNFSWKSLFYYPTITLSVSALFWIGIYLSFKKDLVKKEKHEIVPLQKGAKTENGEKAPGTFRLIVISGALFCVIPTLIHGMLKEGVMCWVPTMITEIYTMTPAMSVFISAILPIVNLAGPYAATFAMKKIFPHEFKSSVLFYVIAFVPLCFILLIGKVPAVLIMLFLSITTACMYAQNFLLISLVSVRFAKFDRVSSVTGVFNLIAFFGSALSNYGFGLIAERLGWIPTIIAWLIICFIAIVASIPGFKKWQRFVDSL